MSSIFATQQEVADFYCLSLPLFCARLAEEPRLNAAWKKGRAEGRLALRQAQFDAALGLKKGNAAMMIWLGKQTDALAQEERPVQQTKTVNVSVRYEAEWGATPGQLGRQMDGEEEEAEGQAEGMVAAEALVDEIEDAVLEDVEW